MTFSFRVFEVRGCVALLESGLLLLAVISGPRVSADVVTGMNALLELQRDQWSYRRQLRLGWFDT